MLYISVPLDQLFCGTVGSVDSSGMELNADEKPTGIDMLVRHSHTTHATRGHLIEFVSSELIAIMHGWPIHRASCGTRSDRSQR